MSAMRGASCRVASAQQTASPRVVGAPGAALLRPPTIAAPLPTISLGRPCRRRPSAARPPACRRAARRCGRHAQHLVEFVADEDDRQPSAPPSAQRGEQRLALLRRQHRGGLVEDQDARVAREPAPSGSRRAGARPTEIADARVRDRRAGRSAARSRAAARRRAPARRGRHSGSVPSITLSSTDRLSASVKCWWTMPMPLRARPSVWTRRQRRPSTSILRRRP